jgi:hypothetical protein
LIYSTGEELMCLNNAAVLEHNYNYFTWIVLGGSSEEFSLLVQDRSCNPFLKETQ